MNSLNSMNSILFSKKPISSLFPTTQSTIPNFGNYVCVNLDGSNMVMCSQGGSPAGDPYTFLYWSDNFGETLTKATIDGVINQKFFGCVAISGANAIAMGRKTSGGTNNFYLSSDYGKTYSIASGAGTGSGINSLITMSGANAAYTAYQQEVYVSTNYGATWTSRGYALNNTDLKMYGNYLYLCALSPSGGLFYSTNLGVTFTKSSTNVFTNCITQIGTTLYVGGTNVIYKSTNNGVSLTAIFTSTSIGTTMAIASCSGTSNDFIIVSNDGSGIAGGKFNYSNDGGSTFQQVTFDLRAWTLHATPTRIVAGNFANLYWGVNRYII